MNDIAELEKVISQICNPVGEIYVAWFRVQDVKVLVTNFCGDRVFASGESDQFPYFASEKEACEQIFDAFMKEYSLLNKPETILWRIKPRLEAKLPNCFNPVSSQYRVYMRLAFLG